MLSKFPWRAVFLVGWAWLALPADAAESQAPAIAPAKIVPVPAGSTLVSTARLCNIPLQQLDAPLAEGDLTPGDSSTALLTLFEKGDRRTQWILFLQVMEEDHALPAPKPASPMTLYSSRGSKLEFSSKPTRASLRTLGPFTEPHPKRKLPKMLDQTDRFLLDKGFLGLGFDQAAAAILRIRQVNAGGFLNFRGGPFPEADIQKGKQLAEKVQLTEAEERALAGSVPALMSYMNILQHAKGLEDVASKIIARPSLWSIVKEGGVSAVIWFRRDQVAAAPETLRHARYQVPLTMELNKQPALHFTLFVTAPQSPLLVCGGVVGLLAEKPDDPASYLTLQVLSARRAEEKQ